MITISSRLKSAQAGAPICGLTFGSREHGQVVENLAGISAWIGSQTEALFSMPKWIGLGTISGHRRAKPHRRSSVALPASGIRQVVLQRKYEPAGCQ